MEYRLMWEKSNLKQFSIRQQHNVKKMKGYEYFRKAQCIHDTIKCEEQEFHLLEYWKIH